MRTETYLTRETLLKRIKNCQDESAWHEFHELYQSFIFAVIARMNIFQQDREDLFQHIMLTLWNKLPQFDYNQQQGKFRNWLYTVTKHEVLAFLKSQNRYQTLHNQLTATADSASNQNILGDLVQKEWELHLAAMAFKNIKNKVSEACMDAFLAGLEGEAVEQTAERLKLNEKSIYVYRMRVKNALAAEVRALKDYLE